MALDEMPAEFSGITEEQRRKVSEHALLVQNPETAQEISDLENAASTVEAASRAVRQSLKAAGVKDLELRELLGGRRWAIS